MALEHAKVLISSIQTNPIKIAMWLFPIRKKQIIFLPLQMAMVLKDILCLNWQQKDYSNILLLKIRDRRARHF